MKTNAFNIIIGIVFCIVVITNISIQAQQFNSDNYLSKPHGVATIILTYGERNSMIMNTFSLFPRWEFTVALYIYNNDNDPTTDDGYSNSLYFKYMIYENEAKTGGWAVKAGTGLDPGYLDGQDRVKDAFQTYWMNSPITLAFFDNTLSWDIMPGASVTKNYGSENETVWAFTYATRLAWYPFSPELSIVGEVMGSEGKLNVPAEYRTGLRWEPSQYSVFAITYDHQFKGGTEGAGWEFGVMLFTPPFAKL
jgi:hypothetical protein